MQVPADGEDRFALEPVQRGTVSVCRGLERAHISFEVRERSECRGFGRHVAERLVRGESAIVTRAREARIPSQRLHVAQQDPG